MASEKANMRNHIQALEKQVKELQERVYELEPCQRCDHQKSGSWGRFCEDCYVEKLEESTKNWVWTRLHLTRLLILHTNVSAKRILP